MDVEYRYQIDPLPDSLGGGWKLTLFKGDREVGGGVYPSDILSGIDWAYENAMDDAIEWLASVQPGGDGVKGTVE